MADEFRIVVENKQAIQFLTGKREEVKSRVIQITRLITRDIQNEAKDTLRSTKHIWKARLINSIFARTYSSGDTITGEVYTGTDYSIYIHEGTKKHYVGFYTRSGTERIELIRWAVDHKLIHLEGDQYISDLTGKPIRGIVVGIKATKFLEQPHQKHVLRFVEEIRKASDG